MILRIARVRIMFNGGSRHDEVQLIFSDLLDYVAVGFALSKECLVDESSRDVVSQ